MKFAARVGWLGLGGEECDEDESPTPHVLRRGEGTAGVVGFGGTGTERWSRGVVGTSADLSGLESFMEVEDDEPLEEDKTEGSARVCSRGWVEGNDSPVAWGV
jgi:hypothetical protein